MGYRILRRSTWQELYIYIIIVSKSPAPSKPLFKLDSLLMLKFPPSSIWWTKSELVSIKLKLNMRIIQNSFSQICHSFCVCRRVGLKRRRQGQCHVRCMSWWQSTVQRNGERKDGIALWYYWKQFSSWMSSCLDVYTFQFVMLRNNFERILSFMYYDSGET